MLFLNKNVEIDRHLKKILRIIIMKKISMLSFIICITLVCAPVFAEAPLTKNDINKEALRILNRMSLKEKIGQKLMLDFRYWCSVKPRDNQSCTQDFINMNPIVKNIMSQNHIGGV